MDNNMYHPDLGHLQPQSTSNRQGRSGNVLTDEEYDAVMAAVDHVYDTSYQTYLHILGPNENGDIVAPPDAIKARIDWCKDAAVTAVKEARMRARDGGYDDPYPTEDSVTQAITEYLEQNGVAELGKEFPGVARELARMVLPVATYSQLYWTGNLRNIYHFLKLRCDAHAQYEIKVFADAILEHIEPYVPWATEAFRDYSLYATQLSRMETEVIRNMFINANDGFGELARVIGEQLKDAGSNDREIKEFMDKFFN